mgnify:CR=1 FL=1
MLHSGQYVGKYRIKHTIGSGGMAVVYRATDTKTQRDVALKLLPSEYTRPEYIARFTREAKLLAKLSHPNIVKIHEVLEQSEGYCFTMELIEGDSLDSIFLERRYESGGGIAESELRPILLDVLKALAAAHLKNILHRDVKPANVVVDRKNERSVLLDFGLARGAGEKTLTKTGTVMGTLMYLAPEQVRGKRASKATDVYQWGMMAYHLLTGHLPFEEEDELTMALLRSTKDIPSIREYGADVSELLTKVVMRCVDRNPSNRYKDCGELYELLEPQEWARARVAWLSLAPEDLFNDEVAAESNKDDSPDASSDASPDASLHASSDANLHASPDANLHASPDASPDASLRASPDEVGHEDGLLKSKQPGARVAVRRRAVYPIPHFFLALIIVVVASLFSLWPQGPRGEDLHNDKNPPLDTLEPTLALDPHGELVLKVNASQSIDVELLSCPGAGEEIVLFRGNWESGEHEIPLNTSAFFHPLRFRLRKGDKEYLLPFLAQERILEASLAELWNELETNSLNDLKSHNGSSLSPAGIKRDVEDLYLALRSSDSSSARLRLVDRAVKWWQGCRAQMEKRAPFVEAYIACRDVSRSKRRTMALACASLKYLPIFLEQKFGESFFANEPGLPRGFRSYSRIPEAYMDIEGQSFSLSGVKIYRMGPQFVLPGLKKGAQIFRLPEIRFTQEQLREFSYFALVIFVKKISKNFYPYVELNGVPLYFFERSAKGEKNLVFAHTVPANLVEEENLGIALRLFPEGRKSERMILKEMAIFGLSR